MSKPQTNAKEAYDAGAKAKRQGFGRVTPYYRQPRSDYWWLAGFDGVEFFEAEERQPEFHRLSGKLVSQDEFDGYRKERGHDRSPLDSWITETRKKIATAPRDAATIAAEERHGIFLDAEDLMPL